MSDQHIYTIRPLTTIEEFEQVITLQSLVFGDDVMSHLSIPTLIGYKRTGQHLLGVFEDDTMFGYCVAYFGTYNHDLRRPAMSNLKLSLDHIAIHPENRSIGLGSKMVETLREIANQQAIRLVTTHFSPLNGRMAYLMIRKLGAIVQRYTPNFYPESILYDSLQSMSGQLEVEWWITGNRAEERLFGKRKLLQLDQYLDVQTPIINPTSIQDNGLPVPFEKEPTVDDEHMILIEIPADYRDLAQRDPDLARAWQDHIEEVLSFAFETGFVVTDFLHDTREGRLRSFYLMSFDGPPDAPESLDLD